MTLTSHSHSHCSYQNKKEITWNFDPSLSTPVPDVYLNLYNHHHLHHHIHILNISFYHLWLDVHWCSNNYADTQTRSLVYLSQE